MKYLLLIFPLLVSACVPVIDPATAAGVIAQATADEQARLAAVTITVEQAQLGATAQAVDLEAQRLRAQMDADATLQAVRLSAAQTQSAGEALVLQARLAALAPTPTPTPDAVALRRESDSRDALTYGGMIAGGLLALVVIVGVAAILGAAANKIEGQARADKIRAEADAEATRIRAEAEAQATVTRAQADAWRASMMQVQPGVQIVSQSPGGVHLLSLGGQAPAVDPLPGPAPIRRMINDRPEQSLDRLTPIDRQAVAYLDECASRVGWSSVMLPPASETGDNSERQPVIDRLKALRLVYTRRGRSGGGTYLTGPYPDLRALRDALAAGGISLSETTQTT